MSGSDRDQRPTSVDWVFAFVGILAAVGVAWGIGYLQSRESEHRYHTPRSYQQSAKADAERACLGREPAAMFECVNEHVEAAQQAADAEQDLSAQQRAASSALAAAAIALATLIVTIIGVWFVKWTLDATLEAVEDTSEATREMKRSNEIAEDSAKRQMRAYLCVERFELTRTVNGGTVQLRVTNFGQTPALNVIGEACFAEYDPVLEIWIPLEPLSPKVHDTRNSQAPSKTRVIDALKVTGGGGRPTYKSEGPGLIPDKLIHDVLAKRKRLIAWGSVEYADVFDEVHRSEALGEMGAYKTDEGIMCYFGPLPDHNGIDKDCRFQPDLTRWNEYFQNRSGEPRPYIGLD